jgi:hypothetical protein
MPPRKLSPAPTELTGSIRSAFQALLAALRTAPWLPKVRATAWMFLAIDQLTAGLELRRSCALLSCPKALTKARSR